MKQLIVRLICFILLIAQLSNSTLAQTQPESTSQQFPSKLEKDIAVERQIKGGEVHAYAIKLNAGQFVKTVVDQRGIDVVVVLFAPDGKQFAEIDSSNSSKGSEQVFFVANESGDYRLEVRPLDKAAAGQYEIKTEELRTATAEEIKQDKIKNFAATLVSANTEEARSALLTKDKELITVELVRNLYEHARRFRLQENYPQSLTVSNFTLGLAEQVGDKMTIGETLFNIGLIHQRQGNNSQALEAYQKSIPFNEAAGKKDWLASAVFNLGLINFIQGNFAPALEYFRKSLKLNEELGNQIVVATTLNRMSNCYLQLGDFTQGLEYAQKSLTLSETMGNKELIANASLSIGLLYTGLDYRTRALEFYQKSLALSEESGNKGLIANALEKIGRIYFSQGDTAQALEYFRKSLKLSEELKNKRQIIFATEAIGTLHRSQGDYAQAMEYFRTSLKLSEELGNKLLVAVALNNIGNVYNYQGDYLQAINYLQKSLKLREEIGNERGVLSSLNKIGEVYRFQGDYEQALEYYRKSLKLSEKIGSKGGMRDAFNNIGAVYNFQGNYEQAMDYSQKSLALSEELEDKLFISETLTIIGNIHFSQGKFTQALEYAKRAATIAQQTNIRYDHWNALVTLGKVYRALKQFDKSRQAFEEAINTIELSRTNIAGQESRATYFATVQQPYELYIDLLMQLHWENPNKGYDVLALQISERARARSLLELLNESNTDIRQGVAPELLGRERLLQQQLNARAEEEMRLLSEKHKEEQTAVLKKEIVALTAEYQNIKAQIRQQSPRYAALTQPQPLKLSEIQQEILDRDTILLEYALGETKSYLWAVTKDSVKSYELPPRSEIEGAIKKAYALLSDGNRVIDDKAQDEYKVEAARLSQMLLAPVATQLQNKRIIIVADGALQYLPFGALPSPLAKNSRQPLIVENEIVNLPSVSVLSVLRRETTSRPSAKKSVAVFADPVFTETDDRLATVKANQPKGNQKPSTNLNSSRSFLERAFNLSSESNEPLPISRLPFSRREAEAIMAFSPSGSSLKALDFKANREAALSPDLSGYRIVHFATHGLLNSEHPELSGIVLSLVNEQGQSVDGFLRLNEIYNMNLSADLVVLSACQTALGKEIRGEGLIGLTRGFMYAGSPRVVASLWKVDDVATAELMKLFYKKIFEEKMRPAAALRAAKVEMLKQKRWSVPFYWAAFEIQGEWR